MLVFRNNDLNEIVVSNPRSIDLQIISQISLQPACATTTTVPKSAQSRAYLRLSLGFAFFKVYLSSSLAPLTSQNEISIRKEVGALIRRLRSRREITQAALASLTGINRTYLSRNRARQSNAFNHRSDADCARFECRQDSAASPESVQLNRNSECADFGTFETPHIALYLGEQSITGLWHFLGGLPAPSLRIYKWLEADDLGSCSRRKCCS
jgi:hypothetical protein